MAGLGSLARKYLPQNPGRLMHEVGLHKVKAPYDSLKKKGIASLPQQKKYLVDPNDLNVHPDIMAKMARWSEQMEGRALPVFEPRLRKKELGYSPDDVANMPIMHSGKISKYDAENPQAVHHLNYKYGAQNTENAQMPAFLAGNDTNYVFSHGSEIPVSHTFGTQAASAQHYIKGVSAEDTPEDYLGHLWATRYTPQERATITRDWQDYPDVIPQQIAEEALDFDVQDWGGISARARYTKNITDDDQSLYFIQTQSTLGQRIGEKKADTNYFKKKKRSIERNFYNRLHAIEKKDGLKKFTPPEEANQLLSEISEMYELKSETQRSARNIREWLKKAEAGFEDIVPEPSLENVYKMEEMLKETGATYNQINDVMAGIGKELNLDRDIVEESFGSYNNVLKNYTLLADHLADMPSMDSVNNGTRRVIRGVIAKAAEDDAIKHFRMPTARNVIKNIKEEWPTPEVLARYKNEGTSHPTQIYVDLYDKQMPKEITTLLEDMEIITPKMRQEALQKFNKDPTDTSNLIYKMEYGGEEWYELNDEAFERIRAVGKAWGIPAADTRDIEEINKRYGGTA